ncbi:MAG: hypothetical protein JNK95_13875 [Candidatus Competibacter sp.]|nr:hypothetical protein [Candidatus Competibacter sp.]MDG4606977.1 hypothetical protein [Candidatus Contendobacter sp.]HRD49178.1 hypothetical protein [Candidatus Contendobacter sp.]
MKVNVSVEATAQEMREFLGLPNVQPLHDDILKTMRDSVQRGVINLDALNMFKPLLPAQFHSMEMVQKFWEAFAKAGGASKDGAERKTDSPDEPDSAGVRNGAEKSA